MAEDSTTKGASMNPATDVQTLHHGHWQTTVSIADPEHRTLHACTLCDFKIEEMSVQEIAELLLAREDEGFQSLLDFSLRQAATVAKQIAEHDLSNHIGAYLDEQLEGFRCNLERAMHANGSCIFKLQWMDTDGVRK